MDVLVFIFRAVVLLVKLTGRLLLFLAVTLLLLGRGIRRRRAQTHGSARWASLWSIWRSGNLGRHGIILAKKGWRYLVAPTEGYALVVAKTRSGKSGLVIPTILTNRGSLVVNDPKGECHAITHRARAKVSKVVTLNMIDPLASDCFNPLSMIRGPAVDYGVHEADDALALANLLVEGGPHESHWDSKARELLAALFIYVTRRYADDPLLCTLAKVRSLTALGLDGLPPALHDADTFGSAALSEVVSALRNAGDSNEMRSIISNADKALMLFSADRPAGIVTRKSDFTLEAMAWERTTLYVMIPEEKLPVYKGVIRVFIGCALNAITRQKTYLPTYRTTFVLDEAAALGHIPELETGVGYLAGYASLLLVFQDFGQIEASFPKARSIIGNAAALVCFGVRDLDSARKISEMIGVKNQLSYSEGISKASTAVFDRQDSSGIAETGRALLDPAEILRLKDHEALIFMDKVRFPIRARKIRYWKEWRFLGRWDRWRVPRRAAPALPARPLSPQA